MSNNEYQSLEEAIKAKEDIEKEIHSILDRDLSILDPDERSIGKWFGLLGKDSEFEETALKLDNLQMILIDTEKYISECKTIVKLYEDFSPGGN